MRTVPRPVPPAGPWAARAAVVAVPGLVAGGVLALSLPPFGFWPLAFVAAAVVWWRLAGLRLRARFGLGFCCGLTMFGVSWEWITAFNVYGGIVAILAESLLFGLGLACCPRKRGRILGLPGAMVLAEAFRDRWPFGGVPLGSVALGQVGGPLGGAARLGGALVLVGVVWAAGAALGGLLQGASAAVSARAAPPPPGASGRHPRTRSSPRAAAMVAAGLAGVAGVVAIGVAGRLAPDGGAPVGHLRVASVQGGGVRGLRKSQVDPATVLAAQFAATAAIGHHDGGVPPRLVLWPEDVVSLPGPLSQSPALGELEQVAKAHHATLLAGITETATTTTFDNEVCAFTPAGRLDGCFEKVHRVPFGEYVPFRSFFSHLAGLQAVPQDAVPGTGSGLLRTPAGPLGIMISYEVFFADRGRSSVRAGAHLLLVPTNTSSYSTGQVPCQEIAASRLQAIEEGRDLVQAAPTGFSALIDNGGRVLQRGILGARQVLVGDVALRAGATVYERYGDLPVVVLAVFLLLAGWWLDITEPNRQPEAEAVRHLWTTRHHLGSRGAMRRGTAVTWPEPPPDAVAPSPPAPEAFGVAVDSEGGGLHEGTDRAR